MEPKFTKTPSEELLQAQLNALVIPGYEFLVNMKVGDGYASNNPQVVESDAKSDKVLETSCKKRKRNYLCERECAMQDVQTINVDQDDQGILGHRSGIQILKGENATDKTKINPNLNRDESERTGDELAPSEQCAKKKKKRKKKHSSSLVEPATEFIDPSKRGQMTGSSGESSLGHPGDACIPVALDNMGKNTGDCLLQTLHSSSKDAVVLKSKLLILDINGVLVDVVRNICRKYKPDAMVSGKAVYKRPFCDEFIDFCFEQFEVGVWSSRKRRNLTPMLDLVMGEKKNRLLFCWDLNQCTETGYKTPGNRDKPLVLKELKKLWEKHRPDVPWDKGYYNETNTVLLDDSPYKALRNPLHTAIFPHPFVIQMVVDNSLGPNGDLRQYLTRLAEADDVQNFIRQNPYGQKPITQSSSHSWKFYSKIVDPKPSSSKKPKKWKRA